MVCRLNKSLYGLKQAPRAWYSRFATFLVTLGFTEAKSDMSLFVYRHGDETAYLLLYVVSTLQRIIISLQQEFAMKDLGVLHHFLGVTVEPRPSGLLLHQRQYTLDILERVGMTDCNPAKLSEDVGTPVADPTAYRSLAGALQYLTFTRPDITYAVQQVCLHMHDPREPHLTALKRLLRYLRGTVDYGLLLHRSSSAELVVYTDADWARCPDTRRSTSGYAVFLGSNLPVVSGSSSEAEYWAIANSVAEASWLRQLLAELHSLLTKSTLVYCDNVSAMYLSTNPVQHQRTKHVEIDLHFVRDRVAIGDVRSGFLCILIDDLIKWEIYSDYLQFEDDAVLIPRETAWFGYYPDGAFSPVLPPQETKLYIEDWIGLRTLDEAGRVKFVSVPGGHLRISKSDMKKYIVPYLTPEASSKQNIRRMLSL
ncbi:hypothetical protein U9M48_008004 [Paspalum notatum var. saurae]|uniref:Reverse transcriptase Ty1/copia-type domain-containing protein n=1 Tax=Paspalum notatum var. saurae TaxID=547442 RepID=A0AAQ3SNA1_PASNO